MSALRKMQLAKEAERTRAAQEVGKRQSRERAQALWAELMAQLSAFGVRHRDEIQRSGRGDAQWRARFLSLFRTVGVDPLASSKSEWSKALGADLVRFYADLAIAAANVCQATRPLNGGLISLADLTERLNRRKRARPGGGGGGGGAAASAAAAEADAFTQEDVRVALGRLSELGSGFGIVALGGVPYVRSVDEDLASDGAALLSAAAQHRSLATTAAKASAALGWGAARTQLALDSLLGDGTAWLDIDAAGQRTYYFPFFMNL
jgi:ESCRT-II complex subunit VPS22